MAIVGEVGSGKTQLVNTLSEITPFSTEVESTINIGKKLTTVGIDYGRISIGNGSALGLFGLPGQARFDFLWRMTCQSLWGVVILVRHAQELDCSHLNETLRFFEENNPGVSFVVGLTHCEAADDSELNTSIATIQAILDDQNLQAPIIPFDPRDATSALLPLTVFNSLQQY